MIFWPLQNLQEQSLSQVNGTITSIYDLFMYVVTMSVSIFLFLEKLNIRFVPAEARAGLITAEEKLRLAKLHEENKHFLRIPRR